MPAPKLDGSRDAAEAELAYRPFVTEFPLFRYLSGLDNVIPPFLLWI